MKRLFSTLLLGATINLVSAQGSFEAIQDYSSPGGGLMAGTAGWSFQVQSWADLTVTSLGCFTNAVGPETLQVGLWAANGTLLAQTTVNATNELFNQSYYQSITPVHLTPGQTYQIGAFSTSGSINVNIIDASVGFNGWFTNMPAITQVRAAQNNNASGLSRPTTVPGPDPSIYLGPNFRVPEPSALALLALAGLGLAAWRKARRP